MKILSQRCPGDGNVNFYPHSPRKRTSTAIGLKLLCLFVCFFLLWLKLRVYECLLFPPPLKEHWACSQQSEILLFGCHLPKDKWSWPRGLTMLKFSFVFPNDNSHVTRLPKWENQKTYLLSLYGIDGALPPQKHLYNFWFPRLPRDSQPPLIWGKFAWTIYNPCLNLKEPGTLVILLHSKRLTRV